MSYPTTNRSPGPWYREPMVWLVIAIPMSAVVMGTFMLVVSIATWDGLVADDYDKRGREINQILSRDRVAARANVRADVEFDLESRRLVIRLEGERVVVARPVELRFLHPTRAGLDRSVSLPVAGDSAVEAPLPPLGAGNWIVQIGNLQWRLVGSVRLPEQRHLSMRPLAFD